MVSFSNIKSIKEKPYFTFWFFGAVFNIIYALSYLFNSDSRMSINIYDTYYVMSRAQIIMTFGLWFLICGFVYYLLKLFKRKLFPWLSTLHLILSLLALGLILSQYSNVNFLNPSKRFYEITVYPDVLNLFGILFFIIAQVLFFVNVVIGVIFKQRLK